MKKTAFLLLIASVLIAIPQIATAADDTSDQPNISNAKKKEIKQRRMKEHLRKEMLMRANRDKIDQTDKKYKARQDRSKRRLRPNDVNRTRRRNTMENKIQQLYEEKMPAEVNKNRGRTAKLNRIRKLATEENNNELITRVDKLLMMERYRYQRKCRQIRMQERNEMLKKAKRSVDKQQQKTSNKTER